jgi:hypothetical protein
VWKTLEPNASNYAYKVEKMFKKNVSQDHSALVDTTLENISWLVRELGGSESRRNREYSKGL